MADLIKASFRATNGLDAAGEKVINVATADKTKLTDGVNVDFFFKENTIQLYDTTRGYDSGFAIIYNNRLWVSNRIIPEPAGAFQETFWTAIRTDPKWTYVDVGPVTMQSGDYISANTSVNDLVLTLPNTPNDGETIFVRDVGGNLGYKSLKINTSNQRINFRNSQITSFTATRPYSQLMFVFSNRLWQLYVGENESIGTIITPSTGMFRSQAGDIIIRRYTTSAPCQIGLPKNAVTGDIIRTIDLDGLSPQNHLIVTTFDNTSSIGTIGTHSAEFRTAGDGFLVYDASDSIWRVYDADLRTRISVVTETTDLSPNQSVIVFGDNNATSKDITLNLPTDVAFGDTVEICLSYIRHGQTVTIKANAPDLIASTKLLLQFPRRSDYPPDVSWYTSEELIFNGYDDYAPTLELAFLQDPITLDKYWVVSENIPTIERVDATNNTTRKRLGVIALASQEQANVDLENNPEKSLAITPELLANRTSTESRRGIARLASTAEVNQDSTSTFLDTVIVTPKKLNERTATETRRGLAEIATQAETNTGTDDTTIVTPKKFAARKATTSMNGIITLVSSGAIAASDRDNPGTLVYNYNDTVKAITPATLHEARATKTTLGQLYQATETEVISAPIENPLVPLAVSPEMLHKKTATTTRIGFTQTATQAEVNAGTDNFKYVTPNTLNGRNASEILTGIAKISTQNEFDAGLLDNVISTPLKIAAHFSDVNRTEVISSSGLTQSGNLWNHYTLNILEATNVQRGTARLATQSEVDAGVEAKSIVTAATLSSKKATETTEGIIRVATQAESVAGTSSILAISPKNLKYIAQTESTWESTPLRRGFVKMTEGALTWVGNNTVGNTQDVELYAKNGYAISPYELNLTLSHYLPIEATAVNSTKFDNLASTQFIRRDINQTVDGILTLTKQLNTSAPVLSSSTGTFVDVVGTNTVNAGNSLGTASISILGKANNWKFNAVADGTTLLINDVLTLNQNGNASVKQTFNIGNRADSVNGYSVGGVVVLQNNALTTEVGNIVRPLVLKSPDASNIIADDGTQYKVLTEKNAVSLIGTSFVKKIGDTMTGRLTVNSAITVQLSEASISVIPTETTRGMWTAEVTTPAQYNLLPGYAVPVFGTNQDGSDNAIIVSYNLIKGPGTLAQFGVGTNYSYQVWNPRPTAIVPNHFARTQWIRNFNPLINGWDEWARVFTSQTPPTASDIGAVSSTGSAFNNMTVRDWLQIGNVRITPNVATRTVEFDWID
ncbi:phage long tail fiber proximal subunit [Yersinia phage phiR1-RT]|uniref:Phage long tail fiber proximal subunit n=1 Tax=Yersinia phage phiR1-RT TaxID=1206558 RepID=I7K3B9_BPPR1|nr:tail fiber protein proximal subunit [Yersinia phage phiR1-RT]CCI88821.1 phage long tail fiber proximal subunit [Yersinia phage phiR1-RT]